jgi:hypothetical protein
VIALPGGYQGYGVGYPYDAGTPYRAPVSSTPTDNPYPESPQGNGTADQTPSPSSGWLELRLAPATAQVYVDGYYVGEVSDFNQPGGRAVEPGPHRIELRASGYQASAFDVYLQPDQSVTYREDLRLVGGGAASSATTFYVIAGCYLGSVPPDQAGLPPGCDAGRVKAVEIRR